MTVNGDATKIAGGGNYLMMISSCGAAFAKQVTGPLSASWTQVTNCGDAQAVAVATPC